MDSYPLLHSNSTVVVVFSAGLWAIAHPPSLLRLHLKASQGLKPGLIRFFRFRSRFFSRSRRTRYSIVAGSLAIHKKPSRQSGNIKELHTFEKEYNNPINSQTAMYFRKINQVQKRNNDNSFAVSQELCLMRKKQRCDPY